MYIFTPSIVRRDLDSWADGCSLDASIVRHLDDWQQAELTVERETLTALIEGIKKQFNVNADSILLDSCDALGRLDVQTYTKGTKGFKCSYENYKEGFKNGEYDLYLNTISGAVTEELNITEQLKLELAAGIPCR